MEQLFSDREGKLKELSDSVLLVKDGIVCGGFSADELPDDFEKLKNGEVHFPETDSVFSAGDAGQQIDTEQGMTDLRGLAYYNFRGRLIIPGFTDLHLHAPQYAFRGMRMDHELLEWLNYSAFPEEARFRSADYARKAYRIFADDLKRGASTRAVIFATLHTDATLELMRLLEDLRSEPERRGLRLRAGRRRAGIKDCGRKKIFRSGGGRKTAFQQNISDSDAPLYSGLYR